MAQPASSGNERESGAFRVLWTGRGQLRLGPALAVSFERAWNRERILVGIAYGLCFGTLNCWLGNSALSSYLTAFLVSFWITVLGVLPWRLRLWPRPRGIVTILLLNGSASLLFGCLAFWLSILVAVRIEAGPRVVAEHAGNLLRFAAMWSFIFPLTGVMMLAGEDGHRARIHERRRAERMAALAEEARIVALRAQINPHFFFNALNTIAALIPRRPQDAERAVELLAEALRPALMRDQPLVAPLSQELEIARAYAEIEKLRLGDRVRFEFDIEPGAMVVLVPSLILQPLLENAVRHGASVLAGPCDIVTRASRRDGLLVLELVNSPAGEAPDETAMTSPAQQEGHALRNITLRLRYLFGSKARLCVLANGRGSGLARLTLPLDVVDQQIWTTARQALEARLATRPASSS